MDTMNKALKAIYHELGYTGPWPGDEGKTRRRGGTETDEPQDSDQSFELPPLDEKTLRAMEKDLKERPEDFLAYFRQQYNYPLSEEEIRGVLSEAREAFDHPEQFLEKLRQARPPSPGERTRGGKPEKPKVPARLMLYPDIDIDPDNHKFEKRLDADALGWLFNSGSAYFRLQMLPHLFPPIPKARFRLHTESQFPSGFKYEMKDRQGRPFDPNQKISVALFGDFGTGLYHSFYIARHLAGLNPDYAIHLGDVYYSGRPKEFELHFNQPLEPVIKNSRFFAMNANHEMYSGAFPYFHHIVERRKSKKGWVAQEQEGSYFCLWNQKYQIIGIDTAYHENGRHAVTELNAWLGERLHEGKAASPPRTNILLSPNEPYVLGKEYFGPLYNDLAEFIHADLIDFWFWGNTHYCALFDKTDKAPFIGSCIGHAGHPIYLDEIKAAEAKHKEFAHKGGEVPPARWVDLSSKFPEDIPGWKNPRPDLGNHGYCLMELEGDKIRLTYYDWLKKVQHQNEFSR